MITRIVRLSIAPEFRSEFEKVFSENNELIAGREGCLSVAIKKDVQQAGVYFTISKWNSEADLNAYRKSDLFGSIWPKVKKWFDDKPQAWSLVDLEN